MQKVAQVGASGGLGSKVLNALLSNGFTVTALLRESSKSELPSHSNLNIFRIPDNVVTCPFEDLVSALKGHDALVMTIAGSQVDQQKRLADASVAAGVQRVIPADFGSCDSAEDATLNILPLYAGKAKVRAYLEDLVSKHGSHFSWSAIVCGHFFDVGLEDGLLRVDIPARKTKFLDGGEIQFSATTLERIGLATARILQKPDVTRNRILYIQSVCVTQKELLESLKRVTGAEQWEVEDQKSKEVIDGARAKADEGDHDSVEEIVSAWGLVASNWVKSGKLSQEDLDLENEDLDTIVRKSIQTMKL